MNLNPWSPFGYLNLILGPMFYYRVTYFLCTYFILMPKFLICFLKSRRSWSQSPGRHTALCGVGWGRPAAGHLPLQHCGRPAWKNSSPCCFWEVSAARGFRPISSAIHGEALYRGQEGRERGRKRQSIHQSPTLPAASRPGAEHPWPTSRGQRRAGWEVHLVMILDFLFGFCPEGFGVC
jgi:hypothetical protein